LGKREPAPKLTDFARSLLQLQGSPALRIPAFYCLPKMHKATVAGRPIVSSINSVTYHASVYLHNYLVRLRHYIPSVCTNSSDVILDLKDLPTHDPNLVIVCADVTSLYPSIPIDFGLHAVRNFLLRFLTIHRGTGLVELKDINVVLDILEWVLKNNYTQFMSVVYHQLTGTAMGTPVAVMYADIVLCYVESPCINLNPLYYKRYLDDLFIICDRSIMHTIITLFNRKCPSIQLDAVTHGTSGVFLDIEVSISETRPYATTKLYQKPTNRFMYITPHSSHNPAVFRNLVVTELCRYRLRYSEDADYDLMSKSFYDRLVARGYNPPYLDLLYEDPPCRATLLENLLTSRTRRRQRMEEPKVQGKGVLVYVPIVYNRVLRVPWQEVLELPPDVANDPDLITAHDDTRIIVGAKNPKNAAYYLSRLRNLLPPTTTSRSSPTTTTTSITTTTTTTTTARATSTISTTVNAMHRLRTRASNLTQRPITAFFTGHK
jgi:hypothetical protein